MDIIEFNKRITKSKARLVRLRAKKADYTEQFNSLVEALKKTDTEIVNETATLDELIKIEQSLTALLSEKMGPENLKRLRETAESSSDEDEQSTATPRSSKERVPTEDVEAFLADKRAEIQAIFTSFVQRTDNFIECPRSEKGNYSIPNEYRRKYNLQPGIQGTQARFGQQNFNVLLYNNILSAVKLGILPAFTNFRDPRDANEILTKLKELFKTYYAEKYKSDADKLLNLRN